MTDTLQIEGATVTLNPDPAPILPSEVLTSNGAVVVTDARGRTIKLQRPDVLAQFRIVEAMGDSAMNQAYMGMIFPLLFVIAIDGEAMPKPGTKAEVEALIKQLDEDGVQAVTLGVHKSFAAPNEDAAKNG